MASAEVKVEPEEEIQPSTSGGGEQIGEAEVSDSDEFDDEYITEYCATVDIPRAMTISKELFYTDETVSRCYDRLLAKDKARFDQMKVLDESIKQETWEYGLIEDLVARVVAQQFGRMEKEDVASVMGKEGKGSEGGKWLERVGERLQIKQEPGAEPDKVVVMAIVPSDEATLVPYHIVEDEDWSDCVTIGSEDSDIEEIDMVEVKSILKELADLKWKEADCIDKLAQAIPEMQDSEVVVISEKVQGMDLLKCVHEMYERIHSPHNFRAALAAGKRLFLIYKHNQARTDLLTVPELCILFDIRKTKLYEILRGGKYGKEEDTEKKPLKRIKLEPVKTEKFPEEPSAKIPKKSGKKSTSKMSMSQKVKSTKATPTT